ncbi:MAG: hypothetical protein GX491_09950 [Chloroflexi bacterium]|nr:hypothetical protein [Chloroflexota bacterium]
MSRLLILTRPELAAGFHLAGVDAVGAIDVEDAQEQLETWLQEEEGLVAIDEALFAKIDPGLLRRLGDSERLHYLVIPSGGASGGVSFRQQRIAELTRRAVGFHSIFKSRKPEEAGENEE